MTAEELAAECHNKTPLVARMLQWTHKGFEQAQQQSHARAGPIRFHSESQEQKLVISEEEIRANSQQLQEEDKHMPDFDKVSYKKDLNWHLFEEYTSKGCEDADNPYSRASPAEQLQLLTKTAEPSIPVSETSGWNVAESQTTDSTVKRYKEADASEETNPCRDAVDTYVKETSNAPVFTERPVQDDYKDVVQALKEKTWTPRRQPLTTCYNADEVDGKVPTALSVIDTDDL